MKYFISVIHATLFLLILSSALSAQNQKQLTDRIVAIVNDRIILKSDVDDEILNFMRQSQMDDREISFSEELWYSALQSMVDNYVLLEKAQIDSVVVSDELVDRNMDQRINQLIRQAGSERALEDAFGQSLIQIRAEFREQFREQMLTQQVQQNKISTISITRPEVEEFFNEIPEDSRPPIPEQLSLSQIVIIPTPLEDARDEALEKAQALRDSVTIHEKNFEEMARLYSEDISAPRGGLLPMMPLDDLVSNYSAAAAALQPGGISEVVETQFGFHIIRLNSRSGDNIETNHILIKIDNEMVDEQGAIDKLNAIRDSVLVHDKVFSEMAREYSEDEESSVFGGRILNPQTGRRLLQIDQLEPALYRIALLLDEEGQISEPRAYNPSNPAVNRSFRIVRLDRHIPEHIANLKDDYDQIRDFALQQKQARVMSRWIDELREEVYVEFKIPIPDEFDSIDDEEPVSL
ncbi:MAG: peptidylprolyl isomerase [Balneolaceae bacterium]